MTYIDHINLQCTHQFESRTVFVYLMVENSFFQTLFQRFVVVKLFKYKPPNGAEENSNLYLIQVLIKLKQFFYGWSSTLMLFTLASTLYYLFKVYSASLYGCQLGNYEDKYADGLNVARRKCEEDLQTVTQNTLCSFTFNVYRSMHYHSVEYEVP